MKKQARINDKRRLQIIREVKDFAAQHPGFGPQELYDFMRQRVSGFVGENADAAAKYEPDATVVKRAEINRPQYLLVPGGHVIPPPTAPAPKPTEQEYLERKAGKVGAEEPRKFSWQNPTDWRVGGCNVRGGAPARHSNS